MLVSNAGQRVPYPWWCVPAHEPWCRYTVPRGRRPSTPSCCPPGGSTVQPWRPDSATPASKPIFKGGKRQKEKTYKHTNLQQRSDYTCRHAERMLSWLTLKAGNLLQQRLLFSSSFLTFLWHSFPHPHCKTKSTRSQSGSNTVGLICVPDNEEQKGEATKTALPPHPGTPVSILTPPLSPFVVNHLKSSPSMMHKAVKERQMDKLDAEGTNKKETKKKETSFEISIKHDTQGN